MLHFTISPLLILLSVSLVVANTATSNGKLLSVIQVFRHGLRTPVSFYPNDPYADISNWEAAPGQLINVGKEQHYELGEFTRKRYKDLLSDTYNSTEFIAYTTDVDRTHMSAQSNLAALWKPFDDQIWKDDLLWQPIPVHPMDDRILSGYGSCKTFSSRYADSIGSTDLFATLNEEYITEFQYLTDNSGYIVGSVAGAATIYDTLLIEDLNNFDLPSWTRSVYPEPLQTLAAYNWVGYTYTTEQKKIGSGLFYRDLLKHFESIISNPSGSYYKFKMYSGHDINIAATLDSLGAFIPHSPYYASSLYFELRENKGRHFINIWHKDKDNFQQITAKGCTNDCSFNIFKTLLADYITDEDEFDKLCTPSVSLTSTYDLELEPSPIVQNAEDFIKLRYDSDK